MILKFYDKNNNPDDIQRVVDILKRRRNHHLSHRYNVMSIGCHALKERPIERICKLKK